MLEQGPLSVKRKDKSFSKHDQRITFIRKCFEDEEDFKNLVLKIRLIFQKMHQRLMNV